MTHLDKSDFRSCCDCDHDRDWPYVPSIYNELSAATWNAAYFIIRIYFPNGCDWVFGGECCSVLRCKATGPYLVYGCLKTVISQWGWGFHSGGDTCGPVDWHHIFWWVVTVVSKRHTATIFLPWVRGQYFPTKSGYSPTTLHDVIIQKTTVRTTSCAAAVIYYICMFYFCIVAQWNPNVTLLSLQFVVVYWAAVISVSRAFVAPNEHGVFWVYF